MIEEFEAVLPAIAITPPPLPETRPEGHRSRSRELGPWRPVVTDRSPARKSEAVLQSLGRELVVATPALERPNRPPPHASPFVAQFIAQEVMPKDDREDPASAAAATAAYLATLARRETVLGPADSFSLMA